MIIKWVEGTRGTTEPRRISLGALVLLGSIGVVDGVKPLFFDCCWHKVDTVNYGNDNNLY